MKKLKDSLTVDIATKVVKVGATIGGAAVIGFLLKNTNIDDIKGFKKIFVPLGVFGLAHAAGKLAREAAADEVAGYVEFADTAIEVFSGEYNEEDGKTEFTPEEEELEEA